MKVGVEQLWADYFERRDETAKNELVKAYADDVWIVAKNFLRKRRNLWSRDAGELFSYGLEGLYRSIEAYTPDKGVPFFSFAHNRIVGAMKDGLRDEYPAGFRSLVKNPTATHRLAGKSLFSLDAAREDANGWNEPVARDPDPADVVADDSSDLFEALRLYLSERQTRILNLYYRENRTMAEIGQLMDMSEANVSILHKKAIAVLRQNPVVAEVLTQCVNDK